MLNNPSKKPVLLWCLANIFFALQFILRLSVGILREDIMAKFTIDAAMFSSLSAYYYLGYGISQIPLGLMLDRLSYHLVTAAAILVTATGSYVFITTDSWNCLLLSRFLTGFGSGIAFLSIAKIIKTFFDEEYHAMLIGLSFTFGLTGAVFSTTPLVIFFQWYGAPNVLMFVTVIIASIGLLIMLFGNIMDKSEHINQKSKILEQLLRVTLNYRLMLIGICGGLMVGALEGFADVWAVPMFNQIFGFSLIDSSMIIMYVYFGMCCGGPILVFFATMINSNDIMIFITSLLTIAIFGLLFLMPSFSMIPLILLMFGLGVLCCYQVLVFSAASSEVDSSSSGLAISIINCINMSFGYVFHNIIGYLFASNWQGEINEQGVALYSANTFIYSLSVIPAGCLIAMVGFLFLLNDKK